MNYEFNIHELIYENNVNIAISYPEALEYVKSYISRQHSKDLADIIDNKDSESVIKRLISRCVFENSICVEEIKDHEILIEKIYNDMAGFAFLTKYIYDESVEEINGNAWNDIEIVTQTGYRKLDENFASPKHCLDIVRKMAKAGGGIIDAKQPAIDSYIEKGVRVSAMIPPIVDDECGAVFSVRRQKNTVFTKEKLINVNTASEDELYFLSMCIKHGISIAIAGATGSGKTTDIGYLLNEIPNDYRIYSIEDSRELNLIRKDEHGKILNRVIQTQIKPVVNANELLKKALRFDPDIIVPAEMRGAEAMTAQEAGRTGHTILTTLHASTAFAAYTRILTMCMQSGTTLSEDILMKLIIEAFPIIAFKKQLADKSRKYMKVVEAEDYSDGKIQGRTLFKFVITGKKEKEGKIIEFEGYHNKESNISCRLAEKLIENGADIEDVYKYAGEDYG